MNSCIAFLLSLALAGLAAAGNAQILGPQIVSSAPMVGPAQEYNPTVVSGDPVSLQLTAAQLDQLLGPIALYPDALIALILPAATEASDVVLAARFLGGEGTASIEEQPWDDSVKALVRYPSVVKWMDENLAWTKQVGEAFLEQPAEVMKSLQRLRAAARAAGTLVDTPEQQIVAESDVISIVPTQRDVIYVPYYDPQIVYLPRRDFYYPSGSFFSFSVGYPVGFWLGYNLDWREHRLWMVDRRDRERYWREQRDWRRPAVSLGVAWTQNNSFRPWVPAYVSRGSPRSERRRSSPEIVRPNLLTRETTFSSATYPGRPAQPVRAVAPREASRGPSGAQRGRPSSSPVSPANPANVAPAAASTVVAPTVFSRGNRRPESADRAARGPSATSPVSPAVAATVTTNPSAVALRPRPQARPPVAPAAAPTVALSAGFGRGNREPEAVGRVGRGNSDRPVPARAAPSSPPTVQPMPAPAPAAVQRREAPATASRATRQTESPPAATDQPAPAPKTSYSRGR